MRGPGRILVVAAIVLLAGCGFQLRGAADLPFETLYVPGTAGGVALDLKRTIIAGSGTRVVDDPRQAQAILELTEELREKQVLALSGGGRVREFALRYHVSFRVHDGKGREFVPISRVSLQRDVSFNDTAVLAKEAEEQLLYRDMQADMVQQIMNRLASARRPN